MADVKESNTAMSKSLGDVDATAKLESEKETVVGGSVDASYVAFTDPIVETFVWVATCFGGTAVALGREPFTMYPRTADTTAMLPIKRVNIFGKELRGE